jgi:predicted nucleic acid-binding protein
VKTATPAERAFWDSSGLVLLCAHQRSTAAARRIRARTGPTAIWWGTPVEVQSALQRLRREGLLSPAELSTSLERLAAVSEASLEVAPTEAVRVLAASVLHQYDLRAADALQLAASLVLCREHSRGRAFVCFDVKLATAAEAAGFTVHPSK